MHWHCIHAQDAIYRPPLRAQVGWFLHTPFPSSEIYRTLPVREEVLRATLRADLIGALAVAAACMHVCMCVCARAGARRCTRLSSSLSSALCPYTSLCTATSMYVHMHTRVRIGAGFSLPQVSTHTTTRVTLYLAALASLALREHRRGWRIMGGEWSDKWRDNMRAVSWCGGAWPVSMCVCVRMTVLGLSHHSLILVTLQLQTHLFRVALAHVALHRSVARVAAFPIGIDPERFAQALETEEVQMNIAKLLNRYAGRKARNAAFCRSPCAGQNLLCAYSNVCHTLSACPPTCNLLGRACLPVWFPQQKKDMLLDLPALSVCRLCWVLTGWT